MIRNSKRNDKLLEIKNLNKIFINGNNIIHANNNISFVIPKEKVVGLIGESGSGKTTVGRAIMNLHSPDSGSILFNGNEISGKKLSKSQKKELYNNIQMIFQDPYSSLNGQKNIMSIVKESLTAKKIDEVILKKYTHNKKLVLFYFENELRKSFIDSYWEYREYANDIAIKNLKKIIENLLKFKIYKEEDISYNYRKFYEVVFEIKEKANYKIITKLEKMNDKIISEWIQKQKKLEKGDFVFEDEKKLNDSILKLKEIRGKIKESKNTNIIKQKIIIIEEKIKILSNNNVSKMKNHKNSLHRELSNLRATKKFLSNSKAESKTQKNFLKINLLIKIIDAKKFIIKKMIKTHSTFELGKIMNDIDSIFIDKKNCDKKTLENIFVKYSKGENWNITNQKKIDKHGLELKKLENKLKESILNDSKRSIDEIIKEEKFLKDEVKKNRDIFKKELIKYKQKNDLKTKKQNIAENKRIKKYEKEIIELRKILRIKEKNIFNEIKLIKKYNKDEFKNLKGSKAFIKNQFKKDTNFNKLLEIEIRVSLKMTDVAKQLYNFASIKKWFILFKKKRLKKLFVRKEVFDTLQKVGLNKAAAYRYPHEFSGGMRQRVGIARALISKPKLIIADEPIAALDLSIQAQIVNLLLELKKKEGISLLFIAHDLSMVRYNSDEIIIMHSGRIVEYGDSEKVFKAPVHPYTKNLIKSIPKLSDIKAPFKESKFSSDYLKNYSLFLHPTYHKISENHFVLATKEQVKKWK